MVRHPKPHSLAPAVDDDGFFLDDDGSRSPVSRILRWVDHWEGMIRRRREERTIEGITEVDGIITNGVVDCHQEDT